MRIAICEDDINLCNRVANMLWQHEGEYNIQKISPFYSANQFWFEYQSSPHPYDLVILDIEMPQGLDGLEAGRHIRETDKDVVIVILTAFKKYALEGYDVLPYKYMVKPVTQDQLLDVLQYTKEQMKQTWNDSLNLYRQGGIERIPFDKILFLESRGHNVYVHVKGEEGPRKYYRKMSELVELCDRRFICPHKSYVVNADKIRDIDGGESVVILESGREIPISQPKKAEFLRGVMEYVKYFGAINA